MRNTSGLLRGGRRAGIPNKSTRRVKAFLDAVFEEVFGRPEFKQRLVESIVNLTIEPKLLTLLLAYYAGRPATTVDLLHSGTVTLAELVVGDVPMEDDAAQK